MNERTALEIASRLEALIPIAGGLAVEALRRQHAEIERLTTDLAESRRKSADLEISLQASRDMALRAYGADVCPNCDTALPKGCEGVFANDHDCMWRKI